MKTKIVGIVLMGLIFSFCTNSKNENVSQTAPETLEKSYLALGDSYTIGESVPESDRFPVILVEKLKDKNLKFKAPRIIATTGWTTGELLEAIEKENIRENFDLVTLLIGVNNQYRGLSIEEYRIELQELLRRALIFSANKPENVRVISIPDWGVSPFASGRDRDAIAREIDAFNLVKKEETEKLNIPFINITEISRSGLDKEIYFANDGLHFSGEMHALWVDEILRKSF